MNEAEAMLAIQDLMDGVVWTPETLLDIAAVLEAAGYKVRSSR